MLRLIRRFAAWVIFKTGPIVMVITPTCKCGRRFQVVFEDIGPILCRAAGAKRPALAAEVQAADTVDAIGEGHDLRN